MSGCGHRSCRPAEAEDTGAGLRAGARFASVGDGSGICDRRRGTGVPRALTRGVRP